MLNVLSREDRMRLMRFVCSFAWTDLDVTMDERSFIVGLVDRLGLDTDEVRQVRHWLEVPPRPEEVDPTEVPPQHRDLFVAALRALIERDGNVSDEEVTSLALFEQLSA